MCKYKTKNKKRIKCAALRGLQIAKDHPISNRKGILTGSRLIIGHGAGDLAAQPDVGLLSMI